MIQMIRFFISSTFRGMSAEREAIHRRILPKINKEAKKMGEYVDVIDLRWGLDTDHMGKIVNVCLSQIDACQYNMIVLLGDYYGTVPETEGVIRSQWESSTNQPLGNDQISITQFELEYGLFLHHDIIEKPERICLIRKFRDGRTIEFGQSKDYAVKQNELVDRVCKAQNEHTHVIKYQADWDENEKHAVGIQMFEDTLLKKMRDILEQRNEVRNKNWIERAEAEAKSVCMQLTQHFFGREKLKESIKEAIRKYAVVCVCGQSSSGKSSILSMIHEECGYCRKHFIACGHTERSRTYLDVLLQMIYFLEKGYNSGAKVREKIYSEEDAEAELFKQIAQYEQQTGEEMLIFVDALDKLSAAGDIKVQELFESSKKVKLIYSQIEEPQNVASNIQVIMMEKLADDDISAIVTGNMVVAGVTVGEINDILVKKKQSYNPLYITSALNILQMHLEKVQDEGHDSIYKCFEEIIQKLPEELPDVCWKTIETAGEYLAFPAYKDVCGLIAASEQGIRDEDLKSILGDACEGFGIFRAYLDRNHYFRIQENGCWTFGHDLIKEGVQKNQKMEEYKNTLFHYIQKLPAHDDVKIVEGLTLSSEIEAFELAEKILYESFETNDNTETTLIIQTLHRLVTVEEREKWYLELADKYPDTVLGILEKGLRYNSGPEYERRYPAKELADVYWKHLKHNWLTNILDGIPKDRKLLFCAVCAEYVGIHDDISKQPEAFEYELPVYKFMCDLSDFSSMPKEKKAWIFKIINLVFYSNNKIIKGLKDREIQPSKICRDIVEVNTISENIIKWYRDKIQVPDDQFGGRKDTEGKFLNNIGQYCNAVKDYTGAFPYRIQALQIKAEKFFEEISGKVEPMDREEQALIRELKKVLKKESISVSEHEKFWRRVGEKCNIKEVGREWNSNTKQYETSVAGKMWNQIAVSYRTIATDSYYIAGSDGISQQKKEDEIHRALGCHRLCEFMQSFVEGIQKESAVTLTRELGTYAEFYEILLDKNNYDSEIIDCAKRATGKVNVFSQLDEKEKQNLQSNLTKLMTKIRKISPSKNNVYIQLNNCYKELLDENKK